MVSAVNALVECFVTAVIIAGFLRLFAHLGWLPLMIISVNDGEGDEHEA